MGATALPRLAEHVIIRTQSADALRETYARIYVEPKLAVAAGDSLDAVVSQCAIGGLRVGYGRFGASTSWEFPNADSFLYLMPLEGAGMLETRNHECWAACTKAVMISPAAGYHADYDGSFATISLKIDEVMLTQKFEAMIGAPLAAPIIFEPQSPSLAGASELLPNYLHQLVDTIEQTGCLLPQWWIAQTEQLAAVLLLHAQRHNYSHLIDSPAAEASLSQVKTVESYIEANYDRPLTFEDMAEVSGVSVLSLVRAFKKARGYSPMQFVERIRRERGLFG